MGLSILNYPRDKKGVHYLGGGIEHAVILSIEASCSFIIFIAVLSISNTSIID